MVSVGGIDIPSYYYPPMKFAGFFSPHFRLRRMIRSACDPAARVSERRLFQGQEDTLVRGEDGEGSRRQLPLQPFR